jgi:hypothetical protein
MTSRALEPSHSAWPFSAAPDAELATIRLQHVRAESRLQALGTYSVISGICILVLWFSSFLEPDGLEVDLLFVLLSFESAAHVVAGWWLRKLQSRGRALMTILLVVGPILSAMSSVRDWLRGDAVESLIASAGFSLLFTAIYAWVLWNRQARTVMTRHYLEIVVSATPHIRRRSRLLWALLGLTFVMLLAIATIMALTDPEFL